MESRHGELSFRFQLTLKRLDHYILHGTSAKFYVASFATASSNATGDVDPSYEKKWRHYPASSQSHSANRATDLRAAMFSSYLNLLCIAVASKVALSLTVMNEASILSKANLTTFEWSCWSKTLPRLELPLYRDCQTVAEGIQTLRPYGRPLVFGTEDIPGTDYLLPISLSTGTCKIRILPLSLGPHVNDSFTTRYLSHAINRMALKCVMPPPHIGGEGPIGKKQVLALVVAGLIRPRESGASNRLFIEQGLAS